MTLGILDKYKLSYEETFGYKEPKPPQRLYASNNQPTQEMMRYLDDISAWRLGFGRWWHFIDDQDRKGARWSDSKKSFLKFDLDHVFRLRKFIQGWGFPADDMPIEEILTKTLYTVLHYDQKHTLILEVKNKSSIRLTLWETLCYFKALDFSKNQSFIAQAKVFLNGKLYENIIRFDLMPEFWDMISFSKRKGKFFHDS